MSSTLHGTVPVTRVRTWTWTRARNLRNVRQSLLFGRWSRRGRGERGERIVDPSRLRILHRRSRRRNIHSLRLSLSEVLCLRELLMLVELVCSLLLRVNLLLILLLLHQGHLMLLLLLHVVRSLLRLRFQLERRKHIS